MNAPLSLVSVKIMRASRLAFAERHWRSLRWATAWSVSESLRQHAVGDQFLDVADALVARPFELLERQLRVDGRRA